jgi:hypothetical protein
MCTPEKIFFKGACYQCNHKSTINCPNLCYSPTLYQDFTEILPVASNVDIDNQNQNTASFLKT